MYDTIEVKHLCSCGEKLPDYQTKALANLLETYRLGQRLKIPDLTIIIGSFEIHDFCPKCQKNIEGRAYVKDQLLAKVVELEGGKEKLITEYIPGKTNP